MSTFAEVGNEVTARRLPPRRSARAQGRGANVLVNQVLGRSLLCGRWIALSRTTLYGSLVERPRAFRLGSRCQIR